MKTERAAQTGFSSLRLLIGSLLSFTGAYLAISVVGASSDAAVPAGGNIHETRGGGEPFFGAAIPESPEQLAAYIAATPPTRSTFMASWQAAPVATGYFLDVSTTREFTTFVEGFENLDVGNVTARAVTGLQPGSRYYYRVHAHGASGAGPGSDAVEVITQPATGLDIQPTFDPSITGNANAAAIEACINRAIAALENLFTDPVAVPIRFRYATTDADGTPLGSSTNARSRYGIWLKPWNTFLNALRADHKTSNDNVANTYLPTVPPSGYTSLVITGANGRALGFTDTPHNECADGSNNTGCPYDGIVTLNSVQPFKFTRPTQTGFYDAQMSLEHEMDEILGLGSFWNCSYCQSNGGLRPQDLFAWQGAGSRNIYRTGLRYFSINNGTTRVVDFYQGTDGNDNGDWAGTCPHSVARVQDAIECPGQSADVLATSAEGINLDVTGWDLGGGGTATSSRFDFNHDAKPDFVLLNSGSSATAIWYMNNNVYVSGANAPTLPGGWQLIDIADFNGDGKPDYLLFNNVSLASVIYYLNNNLYLAYASGPTLPTGWTLVGVGDFNSDGKPDYIIFNPVTRQTVIWYMNNNVYVSAVYGPTLSAGWRLIGVADFNRDGKNDYLLFSQSTRQTAIWYMNGVVRTSSAFGPTIASGFSLIGTTDFNRDGKTDFVLFNPNTRQTALWYLNNNALTSSAYGPVITPGWILTAP